MKKNLAAISLALCLALPGTAAASFYPVDPGGLFSTQSMDPANMGDLRRMAIAQVTMKAFQQIFGGFSGNSGTTQTTENGEPVVIQRSGGVLQTPNQSSSDVWMTIPPGGDRSNGLVAISLVADPPHPIESSSGQARAVRAKINVNALANGARLQITAGGRQVQPGEFFTIDADPKAGVYTSLPAGLVQIRIYGPSGQQAGFLMFYINYRVQKFTSFAANPDGQNSDSYQEIKPGTVALLKANESAYIGNAGSKFGEYDAQLDGVTITAVNGREATIKDQNGDEMAIKLPSRGEFKAGDKVYISGKMRQEGDKKFLEAQTVSAEKLSKSAAQSGAAAFGKPGEKNFGDGADFLKNALDSANAEQDRVKRLQDSAKSSLMAPGTALPSAFGGGSGGGMSVQRTVDPNNPSAGAQTIFSRLFERVFGTNAATTASIFEFNAEKGKDGATQILGILAVAALALFGGPAAAAIAVGSGFVLTMGLAAAMALAGDTSSLAGLGQFFLHPLKSAQALFSESPATVVTVIATAVIMQKIGRFLPASFAESLGNYAAKLANGGNIARAMSGAIEGIANRMADMSVSFAQKLGAEGSLRQVMNGGSWGERLGAVAHARALAKEFRKEFGLKPDSGFIQKLESVTDKMGYDIAEAGERVCAALNRGKTPSFQDVRAINMELKRGSEGTAKTIEDTAQQLFKAYDPDTAAPKLARMALQEGSEEMNLLGVKYINAVERQGLHGEFERISNTVERGYFEKSSKTWSQRPLDVHPTASAAGQGTATGQVNR